MTAGMGDDRAAGGGVEACDEALRLIGMYLGDREGFVRAVTRVPGATGLTVALVGIAADLMRRVAADGGIPVARVLDCWAASVRFAEVERLVGGDDGAGAA
jgi:hypothetical protein